MKDIKLHGYEAKAMQAWRDASEEFGVLCFRAIATRAEIDASKVRRAVRGLARKGLVEFVRSSFTEDGETYGAGYKPTAAGLAILHPSVEAQ
ncbi:hypothetical protein [Mycoplana ramosa]|uniref:MarR family transcriptional regulator n=1 Tax=Mycoplana ramosa TaxID=40837 RepID=A0ABW3YWJ8_MYCRA